MEPPYFKNTKGVARQILDGALRQPSPCALGVWNADAGIYKNFYLNERYSLKFRSDLYNLFNHANLFVNGANAGIAEVNAVQAFRDGRRNIPLALKFIF